MNVRLSSLISTAVTPTLGRQKIATDELRFSPMSVDDFSQ